MSTGFCFPLSYRCNGEYECIDHSDESGCPRENCSAGYFTCDDGNCVRLSWKCDGDDDCNDGSDERNCSKYCIKSKYEFERKVIIYRLLHIITWKYRKVRNTRFYSRLFIIVQLLFVATSLRICPEDMFQCTNLRCIPNKLTCNRDDDCGDFSDEIIASCNDSKYNMEWLWGSIRVRGKDKNNQD